jgi:PAS domain S-box-containing protein
VTQLTGWRRYAVAAAAVAVMLGFRLALEPLLAGRPSLVLFTLPIMAAAYSGGLRAGLAATGLSGLAASYVLLPPIRTFAIASGGDRLQQVFLVLAGVFISVLNEGLHRARRRADAAAGELPPLVRQLNADRAQLIAAQAVAPVGSWETNLSTLAVGWSAETHRIFETSAATFHPTHEAFLARIHPDDRAAVNEAFLRSIGVSGAQAIEHRLLMADGRIKYVEERWRAVAGDDGRGRAVGTCQDITDRKLAENALRESDERFRQLADHITDVFWIRSADMRTLHYVSPAFERIWGRSIASLYADPHAWSDFVVEEDRARVLAAFQALGQDPPLDIEYRIARPDGEIRWVHVRAFQVRDAAGQVIRNTGIVSDITQRRLIDAALHESEQRYRALVEWSPEPCAVTRAGTIMFLNPAAVRMIGAASPQQLIGTSIVERVHPDSRALARRRVEQARTSGGALPLVEERFMRLDGTVIDVEIQGTAIVFDGEPALFSSIRDVTASRRAAAALRASAEEFRLLAEAVPQMVWIARADGWNLYFNQRWVEYTGMTLEESAGHGWSRPFHPADRQRAEDAWRHSTETLTIYSLECLLRRADGAYRWWLVRGAPVTESDGSVSRWFGTCTDIHDLKLAQLEAARTNRALTMLSISAGPSAGTGAAFFELMARNMADAIGGQAGFVAEVLPGEPAIARTIAAIVEGETVASLDYPIRGTFCEGLMASDASIMAVLPPGQYPPALARAVPGARGYLGRRLIGASGERLGLVFVLFRDVPEDRAIATATLQIFAARAASELERQVVDAQVREQAALLLRAQRLESIGTLAGGIAHDLNNMLTPILMSVGMLEDTVIDESARTLLATVRTSAQRSADLVKQVLSFAKGVEGERVPIDLLRLMRDLLSVIHGTLPKSIEVVFDPAPLLWTVTGDATQLHQVLMNLCVNARDAMPTGGHLTVTVDNLVLGKANAGINVDAHPGRYVRVRVVDDGTGIPAGIRDRIFEPFFTTKGVGEGTGLGLSTSLAIVKSHGGFMQLDSRAGAGTTFDVYLPATAAEAIVERVAEAPAPLERGHGELVLVVDDEDGILRVARRLLERQGYRAMLAANGEVALSLYRQHQHEIAVVLTDMAMPIMDGPALILALRAINPGVRIIGSSGFALTAAMAQAARDDGAQFVAKPYTGEALLEALQAAISVPSEERHRDGIPGNRG